MGRHKVLNTPAIRRMPTYLHKLMEMRAAGEEYASTSKLAEYVRLEPIVVRKDFELTGIKGFPGVGYKTCELIDAIRRYLGWDNLQRACLVGAGSLGSALLMRRITGSSSESGSLLTVRRGFLRTGRQ